MPRPIQHVKILFRDPAHQPPLRSPVPSDAALRPAHSHDKELPGPALDRGSSKTAAVDNDALLALAAGKSDRYDRLQRIGTPLRRTMLRFRKSDRYSLLSDQSNEFTDQGAV